MYDHEELLIFTQSLSSKLQLSLKNNHASTQAHLQHQKKSYCKLVIQSMSFLYISYHLYPIILWSYLLNLHQLLIYYFYEATRLKLLRLQYVKLIFQYIYSFLAPIQKRYYRFHQRPSNYHQPKISTHIFLDDALRIY